MSIYKILYVCTSLGVDRCEYIYIKVKDNITYKTDMQGKKQEDKQNVLLLLTHVPPVTGSHSQTAFITTLDTFSVSLSLLQSL